MKRRIVVKVGLERGWIAAGSSTPSMLRGSTKTAALVLAKATDREATDPPSPATDPPSPAAGALLARLLGLLMENNAGAQEVFERLRDQLQADGNSLAAALTPVARLVDTIRFGKALKCSDVLRRPAAP